MLEQKTENKEFDSILQDIIEHIENPINLASKVISGVFKGNSPKDKSGTVYWLIGFNKKQDFKLQGEIGRLYDDISIGSWREFTIINFPIKFDEAEKYDFLGECVWKK